MQHASALPARSRSFPSPSTNGSHTVNAIRHTYGFPCFSQKKRLAILRPEYVINPNYLCELHLQYVVPYIDFRHFLRYLNNILVNVHFHLSTFNADKTNFVLNWNFLKYSCLSMRWNYQWFLLIFYGGNSFMHDLIIFSWREDNPILLLPKNEITIFITSFRWNWIDAVPGYISSTQQKYLKFPMLKMIKTACEYEEKNIKMDYNGERWSYSFTSWMCLVFQLEAFSDAYVSMGGNRAAKSPLPLGILLNPMHSRPANERSLCCGPEVERPIGRWTRFLCRSTFYTSRVRGANLCRPATIRMSRWKKIGRETVEEISPPSMPSGPYLLSSNLYTSLCSRLPWREPASFDFSRTRNPVRRLFCDCPLRPLFPPLLPICRRVVEKKQTLPIWTLPDWTEETKLEEEEISKHCKSQDWILRVWDPDCFIFYFLNGFLPGWLISDDLLDFFFMDSG